MGRRRPYYGWVIVAVATLAVFMSSPGQTYVAAVFVDPIQQETGWSRTLISGLSGSFLHFALPLHTSVPVAWPPYMPVQ